MPHFVLPTETITADLDLPSAVSAFDAGAMAVGVGILGALAIGFLRRLRVATLVDGWRGAALAAVLLAAGEAFGILAAGGGWTTAVAAGLATFGLSSGATRIPSRRPEPTE